MGPIMPDLAPEAKIVPRPENKTQSRLVETTAGLLPGVGFGGRPTWAREDLVERPQGRGIELDFDGTQSSV